MRKIFLTTTILLTTGTALAFGGVFNHGSKSTTYKGGVDAIGVHFDSTGKKPNIKIEDENAEDEIICPDDVSKDNNGFCATCDNGNLYFSYREDPCGEETATNKIQCETDADCESGCCSENGYCRQRYQYEEDFSWCLGEGKSCRSNNDCESGEFCNITYYDDIWPLVYFGQCQDIGPFTSIGYNDKAFVQSLEARGPFMGSMNWCHALGMEMAKMEDLGFDAEGNPLLEDMDLSVFPDYYYLNNGLIEVDQWGNEIFHTLDGYLSDSGADKYFMGGAIPLCVANCPAGTYWRAIGKCEASCGEYEHIVGSGCVCDTGFIWSSEHKACICPENWHIVNGECVECANDEKNTGINASECIKLDCGPDACCYFQHRCDCYWGCK